MKTWEIIHLLMQDAGIPDARWYIGDAAAGDDSLTVARRLLDELPIGGQILRFPPQGTRQVFQSWVKVAPDSYLPEAGRGVPR